MNTALSIIIPVYNAEKTLNKCVDSVLSQAFKDFELLLIDDGSKDSSGKTCDYYSSRHERVKVVHKVNGGVSSARNAGLDIAIGKWICFIDSDDYVEEKFLVDLTGHDEDLLITSAVAENKNRRSQFWINTLDNETISDIGGVSGFINRNMDVFKTPWGKLYKRELIADLRFNTKLKIGEDAEFVYNYLSKCRSIATLPQCTYIVRDYYGVPMNIKYEISTQQALRHIKVIFEAYSKLCVVFNLNQRNFNHIYFFFKLLCKNDWKRHPYRWYCSNVTIEIRKYLYSSLSARQKATETVSYIISKALKPFRI